MSIFDALKIMDMHSPKFKKVAFSKAAAGGGKGTAWPLPLAVYFFTRSHVCFCQNKFGIGHFFWESHFSQT